MSAAKPPAPPAPPAHPCQLVNQKNPSHNPGARQQACSKPVDSQGHPLCFFEIPQTGSIYDARCVPIAQAGEGPESSAKIPRLPGPPGTVIPDLYPDSFLFSGTLQGMPRADAEWCVGRCHKHLGEKASLAAVRECANQCAEQVAAAADEPFLPSSASNFQL